MAIVLQPQIDVALSQGDILKGITLFATATPWIDKGTPVKVPGDFCLIISRPCVLAHKRMMVVASVSKYQDGLPKDLEGYDKVHAFLKRLRDGDGQPDSFYLGQLPGENGRFRANLDSLHTVEIPTKQTELIEQIKAMRIGRLAHDFLYHLHVRLFTAVASQGFDDDTWYSTEDLNWLASLASQKKATAEADIASIEAKKHSLAGEGKKFAQQEQVALDKKIAELSDFSAEMNRLKVEQERRSNTE